jgi:hypothetical protein
MSTGSAVSVAAASWTFHISPPYASVYRVSACGRVNSSGVCRYTVGSR